MAEILRWDTARYLNTEEDIEGYLDIIYEDGDEDLIALREWNAERAHRRLLRQHKHSEDVIAFPMRRKNANFRQTQCERESGRKREIAKPFRGYSRSNRQAIF